MNNPIAKLVTWQQKTSQLDGWTSYHIAAGAFLCKVFQWWGWTNFWCVMGVFIIGVLWDVFEYYFENWKPYGSKKKWAYNTIADIIVETAMAWWMVL